MNGHGGQTMEGEGWGMPSPSMGLAPKNRHKQHWTPFMSSSPLRGEELKSLS